MPDDAKKVTPEDFQRAANMDELLGLLDGIGVNNGWAKRTPSLWPLPVKDFVPAQWTYREAKAALDAAGRFVNTELAERRNLIMFNPTPNWCWHGHANESTDAGYWIDFLDVPLTHLLGPMFFEHHEERVEHTDIIAPDSPARFAFTETVRRLEAESDITPGHREIKLGDPALTTIALNVVRLEAGASFTIVPSTLSCIYAVMQGTGSAQLDDTALTFERGDVIAAPSSTAQKFEAKEQCYLLRVTDEPLLRFLGWLRDIEQ